MRYALLQLSREFVEEPPQIGIAGFPTIHGMTESALAARIPSFIPFLFREVGAAVVFIFFCAMMVLQLIWVHFRMPETKGRSIEELASDLAEKNK